MSDSQKPREWRILQGRKESFIQDMTFAAPVGKEINESMVEQIDLAISKSAYDALKKQALAMRETLALTKNNIGFGGRENMLAAIDRINKALEQFDEFMKKKGEK